MGRQVDVARMWVGVYLPLGYLIALGEARSCLAALADSTDDVDLSAHLDRPLIQLDFINRDDGCSRVTGTRTKLLGCLEDAVDRLVEFGVDRLSLELLLVRAVDSPCPPWRVWISDWRHDGPLTAPAVQGLPVLQAVQEPPQRAPGPRPLAGLAKSSVSRAVLAATTVGTEEIGADIDTFAATAPISSR